MQRHLEQHSFSHEPEIGAADADSISSNSVAPPPRYSYRRESNSLSHQENEQTYNNNLVDIGNYLLQGAQDDDLIPRLPSPHSTENLRGRALAAGIQDFSTVASPERFSRPCSIRSPSPHPVRRNSSNTKRSISHQRSESCPIHGYTHTHSLCLPDYTSMTTPTPAASHFENVPPVPRLTAGDFRRLAHSLRSHSPQTFNSVQRDHFTRPSDDFGFTEQSDPFFTTTPVRSSSLQQYRSAGEYNGCTSYNHRQVFNHHPAQPQDSPLILAFQQGTIYPGSDNTEGNHDLQQHDAESPQFHDTKQALEQEVSHVQDAMNSNVPNTVDRISQQHLSIPLNATTPSRPRSSCKPLKITKKASVYGPLASQAPSTFPHPHPSLPPPAPKVSADVSKTATNFVHLSRTTTPPSKKPLFSKLAFKASKSPDRSEARHLIFSNGLRKSLSPASSIIGKFVIDPTLTIPGGLLRAVDSLCLPPEDVDLDLQKVPSRVRDSSTLPGRLERSKSEKRADSDAFDIDSAPAPHLRKNLVLEVKNGGIDVDVHIVPSNSKKSYLVGPTHVDLYVKDTVMRKRKGNKIKAVRNTDPFPLIARIVAPRPRQPIHVIATTMPLPKPDTSSSSELHKSNTIKNDNAYADNHRPSTATSYHRRTQSQPNQVPSRRPTSSSSVSRSPSARTTKTRNSYAHPAMPSRAYHQTQTSPLGNSAATPGSGSGPTTTTSTSAGAGSAAHNNAAGTAGSSGATANQHSMSTPGPVLRHLSLPLSPIHLSLPNTFQGALVVRVSAGNIDAHLTLSTKLKETAVVLSEKGGVRGFFVGGFDSLIGRTTVDATDYDERGGLEVKDKDNTVLVGTGDYGVSDNACDVEDDEPRQESSDMQHVVLESDRDDNVDEDNKSSSTTDHDGPDSDDERSVTAKFGGKGYIRNHDDPVEFDLKGKGGGGGDRERDRDRDRDGDRDGDGDRDAWQGDRLEVIVGDGRVWLQFEDEDDPFGLRDGFWTRLGKSCGLVKGH